MRLALLITGQYLFSTIMRSMPSTWPLNILQGGMCQVFGILLSIGRTVVSNWVEMGGFLFVIGVIVSLFYFSGMQPAWVPASKQQELHYVSGATIYDKDLHVVKRFAGRCGVFLDDGSFILSHDKKQKMFVTKYSAIGSILWEREYYVHHQMNLSQDKKKLLVISSEDRVEDGKNHKYDKFIILDINTGKALAEKSSFDFFNSGSKAFSEKLFYKGESPVHFNSFYDIPENPTENVRPEFNKDNYIINDAFRPYVILVDRSLNIVLEERLFEGKNSLHDVQVQRDGKVLFYRGQHEVGTGRRATVFKYDPIVRKSELIFPEDLKIPGGEAIVGFSLWGGSAQETAEGFLISHNDSVQGQMTILTDRSGHVVRKMLNPEIDRKTDKPADIQQIKQYDLSEFLKNNKM